MKNQWFGDDADHLKWTGLIYLTQEHSIDHIVYITMLTESYRTVTPLTLLDDNAAADHQIANQVSDFFFELKRLSRIDDLTSQFGITTEIPEIEFNHYRRAAYFCEVTALIQHTDSPCVWFFDPDTGIEAPTRRDPTHIFIEELRAAWNAMTTGDILAYYQHERRRTDENWRTTTRNQFAAAINVPPKEIIMLESPNENDAILLAAVKP